MSENVPKHIADMFGNAEPEPAPVHRKATDPGPLDAADRPALLHTADRLERGAAHLDKVGNELMALLDYVGRGRYNLTEAELASVVLSMESIVGTVDALRQVAMRNLDPVRVAMAKKILTRNELEAAHLGKYFRVEGRGFYRPPARTKDPEGYLATIKWLWKEKTGQEPPESIPEDFRIDDRDFTKICKDRLAAGQELPPGASEYTMMTVKVSDKKGK